MLRFFILLIIFVFLSSKGWCVPWPVVLQCQNFEDVSGAAHTSITANITTIKGNTLVSLGREGSNNTDNMTMSDSASQSWTQTTSGYFTDATSRRAAMFFKPNSSAVTTVTLNFTSNPTLDSLIVCEISNQVIYDTDTQKVGGSGTSYTSGSVTTTLPNEILVMGVSMGGAVSAITAGSGYTIPANAGSLTRVAIEYKIVSTIQSAVTASISWTGSTPGTSGDLISFSSLVPASRGVSIKGGKVAIKGGRVTVQ